MRFINVQIIYMYCLACATKQPTDVGRGGLYSFLDLQLLRPKLVSRDCWLRGFHEVTEPAALGIAGEGKIVTPMPVISHPTSKSEDKFTLGPKSPEVYRIKEMA